MGRKESNQTKTILMIRGRQINLITWFLKKQYLTLYSVNMTYNLKKSIIQCVCMYLYLLTSTAWKFICTVCRTESTLLNS